MIYLLIILSNVIKIRCLIGNPVLLLCTFVKTVYYTSYVTEQTLVKSFENAWKTRALYLELLYSVIMNSLHMQHKSKK